MPTGDTTPRAPPPARAAERGGGRRGGAVRVERPKRPVTVPGAAAPGARVRSLGRRDAVRPARRASQRRADWRRRGLVLVLMSPWIVGFTVFFAYPIVDTAYLS